MQPQKTLVRIQQSWLAANEHILLVWMATRMPRWVKPDHLTILGLVGSALCGAGFAASSASPAWLWLSVVGLLVNWAGDSLDGNLARVRRIERPQYGFFVDHTSDIVSQAFIFLGIAVSPYVRFETGCLLLMSYWMAAMFTFIRAISARVFQISYFGIGPTEIRIGLLIYVASLLTVGPMRFGTQFGTMAVMDLVGIAIFGAVLGSFVVMTLWEARRLAALDIAPGRLPLRDGDAIRVKAALALTDTRSS